MHARTHARTRPPPHAPPHPATSPVDCLTHPPLRWPADLVPCSHPRAGGADAALWVPEGPGGSDDPLLPPTLTVLNRPHTQTRENIGAISYENFCPQIESLRGNPAPPLLPPPSGRPSPPTPPPTPTSQPGPAPLRPLREIRAPDQHQHRGPQRPPVPSNKFLLRLRNAVYTSISIYSTNGFGVLPLSAPLFLCSSSFSLVSSSLRPPPRLCTEIHKKQG